jgi:hypothetical protein
MHRDARTRHRIGLATLTIAGFLSVMPGLGPYLPTGLWGMAEELAVGNVPERCSALSL